MQLKENGFCDTSLTLKWGLVVNVGHLSATDIPQKARKRTNLTVETAMTSGVCFSVDFALFSGVN